jgi:hypothetical protein
MSASIFDMPLEELRERAAVVQQMIEVVRDAMPAAQPAAPPATPGGIAVHDAGELVELLRACFDRLPQILPGMRRLSSGERRRFGQSRPDLEARRTRASTGSAQVLVRPGETQADVVERSAILERVSAMVRELTSELARARTLAAAPAVPPLPRS